MTGSEFLYAVIAGLLPSLVWLFFWSREDHEQPEPKSLLAGCFLAGMLAVLFAIPAERYVANLVSDPTWRYTFWAAIEEILKFTAVAAVALHARSNDEPIDAMIYCIAVALGFAALENTLFIMQPFSGGDMAAGIITGNMRFIGATLVHTISSAFIGFALGEAYYRGWLAKASLCVLGLIAAIAVHASFNIAITSAGPADTLKAFGWVWGAVVLLIVLFEEVKAVRPKLLEN
jgi:RsiW-degrading membrane proteinase PrsW (M82 family)